MALNGDLEILKWARNYGCPWNENTFKNATKNEHLNILCWITKYGYPIETCSYDPHQKNVANEKIYI